MGIIFFLLWIIFNGKVTIEIVLFGVVISAVMYAFICRFMDYSIKKDIGAVKKIFLGLQYILVLIWEILKANIHVIRFILSSKYEIEPVLIRFKTDLKTDGARAVLANSITLTPGTITVSLEKNEYVVHCLDKDLAEGVEESVFVKLLRKLEE